MVGVRGHIDFEDVLQKDLERLVSTIREADSEAKIVMAGHSSGGGLALRMADSVARVDGFFLVAPFLKYNAPTTRPNSGGWANVWSTRIAGLSMLNGMGITSRNAWTTLTFNLPDAARDGNETLRYSYNMMNGFGPHSDYMGDLKSVCDGCPLQIVVGENDESMVAEKYQDVLDGAGGRFNATVLPDRSHIDIMRAPELFQLLGAFLDEM
jgi:pimeloyl-ACP methyl ester carboxylesterase